MALDFVGSDPTGDGLVDHGDELTNDPTVVAQTIAAFDTAWEYGIPHEQFQPD